jgi:hypothetical protein
MIANDKLVTTRTTADVMVASFLTCKFACRSLAAGILDTGGAEHITLPCFDHAHAAVEGWPLLTSESRRYRRTFPS